MIIRLEARSCGVVIKFIDHTFAKAFHDHTLAAFFTRESFFKTKPVGIVTLEVCQVNHDTNHITLLAIIFFVTVIINNVVAAIWQGTEVIELLLVKGISQDLIERIVLNGLFGRFSVSLDSIKCLLSGSHVAKCLISVDILRQKPLFVLHPDGTVEVG